MMAHFALRRIQHVVAHQFGVEVEALQGPRRTRQVAHPRQAAMWLARRTTKLSQAAIGRAFGKRDHTTVVCALKAVEARRADDPMLAAVLDQLELRLRAEFSEARAPAGWNRAVAAAAREAVDARMEAVAEHLREAAERDPVGTLERLERLCGLEAPEGAGHDHTDQQGSTTWPACRTSSAAPRSTPRRAPH